MFVVRCDEHCFLLPDAPFEEKGVSSFLGIYKSVIKAYNNGNNPGGKNNGESNNQGNNEVFQEAQGNAVVR